jgi:hypothetical protein
MRHPTVQGKASGNNGLNTGLIIQYMKGLILTWQHFLTTRECRLWSYPITPIYSCRFFCCCVQCGAKENIKREINKRALLCSALVMKWRQGCLLLYLQIISSSLLNSLFSSSVLPFSPFLVSPLLPSSVLHF